MCDNLTRSDHNFSVAEADYHFEFGPNSWDGTGDSFGEGLSYSDPDSPWSSFAPDTPPCVGIVTSDMPLTPQGSSFGISGDDPGENEQYSFAMHHIEENLTVDPSHLDMSQYQATYDAGTQDSGSYINTQACSYSPFPGLGPSGPPPIPQAYSKYSFDQPVEAYQAFDPPLTREQDFNQYNSAEVAGAHPPHRCASSAWMMDPEQAAVGDLDQSLETDSGVLLNNVGTLPLSVGPTYAIPGQVGYTQDQETISYHHSFQHHSPALHQQQPPLSLPLQPSQDVHFEDHDTMEQSSDQEESAKQTTFTMTALGEYQCTAPKCKTHPVFKRKCDLTKHQNNHRRPRKCPSCNFKAAERKDLHRHVWTNHPVYARANKIPEEKTKCDFPGCDYRGRKDNVRRHKEAVGHDREQPR